MRELRYAMLRELPGGFVVSLFSGSSEREFVRVNYAEAESLVRQWVKRDIKDFEELGL